MRRLYQNGTNAALCTLSFYAVTTLHVVEDDRMRTFKGNWSTGEKDDNASLQKQHAVVPDSKIR